MNEVQNRSDIKSGGKAAMLTIVVSYLLGTVILVFFLLTAVSARVNEQDAAGVTGQMRSYTVNDGIRLDDGTVYLVYRQNQTVEFEDDMSRLPPDTTVSLLVVPDPFNAAFHETTMYAVSVETENGVLLDLDAGLKAANASVLKMIVLCAAVLTLNMIALFCFACKMRAEAARQAASAAFYEGYVPTAGAHRTAETGMRYRVLASASNEAYQIVYRRVGTVNELVINGRVYDEKKTLFGWPHVLFAVVDGHRIEAGSVFTGWQWRYACRYILFDGQQVACYRGGL